MNSKVSKYVFEVGDVKLDTYTIDYGNSFHLV